MNGKESRTRPATTPESGDEESDSSDEEIEMVPSKANYTESENTSFVSCRAASTTLSSECSVHSGVCSIQRTAGSLVKVLPTLWLP